MDRRLGILRSLQVGAGLTFSAVVATILWLGLGALGDQAGAAIARGVTWGVAAAWALDLVVLVVLVALVVLEPVPAREAAVRRRSPVG
jgi:hypothetical protein